MKRLRVPPFRVVKNAEPRAGFGKLVEHGDGWLFVDGPPQLDRLLQAATRRMRPPGLDRPHAVCVEELSGGFDLAGMSEVGGDLSGELRGARPDVLAHPLRGEAV